ncbi:MAG: class II D-tagatose-bisphosphate aldolase non-catalytic subunit [Bacillota bacterium]
MAGIKECCVVFSSFDNSKIRAYAERRGLPITRLILDTFKSIRTKTGRRMTLLAVCPNSETVLKAALLCAKKANAPIKFAATLNQVDLDGGYTGWTQTDFVRAVAEYARKIELSVPVIIALDHGGPWLKDLHAREKWDFESTLAAVKRSLRACLEAGYDLLHIDCTVDKTLPDGETIAIETVVERTIQLIKYVEGYRREAGLKRVEYEVGTEEVHGGIADVAAFERFLSGLKGGLQGAGMEDVWPVFVVGKVGTDLHTNYFDSDMARRLVEIAGRYGLYVKGHYTDYVTNPENYPETGMGGANVGPEFTEMEYKALKELVEIEKRLFQEGKIAAISRLDEALKKAVVESGRWKKWLQADETTKDFVELSVERQAWLVQTGCRYIWTDPGVLTARKLLYKNLEDNGYNPEEIVIRRVSESIMKYFRAFNLEDAVSLIEDQLGI